MNVNRLTQCGVKFVFYVADYFALMNNKLDGDIDKIRAFSYSRLLLLQLALATRTCNAHLLRALTTRTSNAHLCAIGQPL
jgi:hypothetical protein